MTRFGSRCTVFSLVTFLVLLAAPELLRLGAAASPGLYAQERAYPLVPEVEDLFKQGVQRYRAGDYAGAYEIFVRLVNYPRPHHRATAALLMEGRTLYKLGRYDQAISELRRLIEEFPASTYVDDAHYVIGNSFYRLGSFQQAVSEWLWVFDNSDAPPLVERSEKLAASVMENKLGRQDLLDLRKKVRGQRSLGLVTLELAMADFRSGASGRGLSVLKEYAEKHPDSPFLSRIQEILSNPSFRAGGAPRVGVILPLTGFYAEQGTAMLRGIDFARLQHKDGDASIELEVRDSEGRMIPTLRAAQQLCNDPDVLAIIGELEPDLTAGVAAVAVEREVPHLSPTSDEVGLAALGPYVFQMTPDLAAKAAALARYAFQELGLRTFATLSPTDYYGFKMTEVFTAEVDRLGGRIVSQTWYYEGALDFRRQLKQIREAGLRLALEDSLRQTGETWSKTAIDSLWEEINRDYRSQSDNDEDMIESDEIPVRSIDGIFIPVLASKEIAYIAPQLAGVRIEAQILGGDYWNDLDVLRSKQIRRHVNGTVFVSGTYWDPNDPAYSRFRRDYRMAMGTTPSKWDIYGYDAMGVLLKALSSGARSRQQLRDALADTDSYQGVEGEISFRGSHRVNHRVYILQFRDGNIYKLR